MSSSKTSQPEHSRGSNGTNSTRLSVPSASGPSSSTAPTLVSLATTTPTSASTSTKASRKPHPTFLPNLPPPLFQQQQQQHFTTSYSSHQTRNSRSSPFLNSPLRVTTTIGSNTAAESYFRTRSPSSSSSPPASDSSPPKKPVSPFALRPGSLTNSPRGRPFRSGVPLSPLSLDPSSSSSAVKCENTHGFENNLVEHSLLSPHTVQQEQQLSASNNNSLLIFREEGQAPLSAMPSDKSSAAKMTSRSYHSHLAAQQLAFQNQQRELIIQATRSVGFSSNPVSPRLLPLGSPGPVTPLALEDNPGGYMFSNHNPLQLSQHVEKLAAQSDLNPDSERKAAGP